MNEVWPFQRGCGREEGKRKWQVCLEGRVCPAVYFQPCWVGATGFTALR